MKSNSRVWVELRFEGDPMKFWEILKKMQAQAKEDGVVFNCGRITTITQE